jgi:hypothetical protein
VSHLKGFAGSNFPGSPSILLTPEPFLKSILFRSTQNTAGMMADSK